MFFKSRFYVLNIHLAVLVALSAGVRTVLLLSVWRLSDPTPLLVLEEYLVGLLFDCVTFSYAAVPFILYLMFVPERSFAGRANRYAVYAGTLITIYLLLFDGVAEYVFFREFGVRFNFIAIDYLIYTREVIGNIWESYRITPILLAIAAVAAGIFAAVKPSLDRILRVADVRGQRLRHGLVYLSLPAVVFLLVGQEFTNISSNQYANELAGNGIYDLFAAFRNSELDYDRFYPTGDVRASMRRLRQYVAGPHDRFVHAEGEDIERQVRPIGSEKRLNVIVIVEESLSAEYLHSYGGPAGLTPNLDRLSAKSLRFTRMYAAGTRTVRGLEAITLSQPPLPGTAVIKRPDNSGFSSWGSVMRTKGYDTRFIYAGYGYFDNLAAFFAGNGFEVVDRADFSSEEISFTNIWGVCDEDLFRRVIRESTRSYERRKPFFSIVMTTSNHRPYTYPEGRVSIPPKAGRGGGVQYADYSVGRFFDQARQQPWFNDTIFVVVADHCAAAAGKIEIPVEHYEIPLLVYAPMHIKPGTVDVIGSQIDIAPTVLGLLNMGYTSRFMGRDLRAPGAHVPPRAFLSTYQKLALLEGDALVVLGPNKQAQAYRYSRKERSLRLSDTADPVVADALMYYQGANYIYTHRLNREQEGKYAAAPQ